NAPEDLAGRLHVVAGEVDLERLFRDDRATGAEAAGIEAVDEDAQIVDVEHRAVGEPVPGIVVLEIPLGGRRMSRDRLAVEADRDLRPGDEALDLDLGALDVGGQERLVELDLDHRAVAPARRILVLDEIVVEAALLDVDMHLEAVRAPDI